MSSNWDKLIIKDNNHIQIEVKGTKYRGERGRNFFDFGENHPEICRILFGRESGRKFSYPGVDTNCYWPAGTADPVTFALYYFKKYHKGKLIDYRKEF